VNNILVLTSGKVKKLDAFPDSVDKASFDDVWFDSLNKNLELRTKNLKKYKLIYFRMVGRSLEPATLVVDYAVKNRIKIIDKIYETSLLMPLSLGKSMELKKLMDAGVPIPKTVFGRMDKLPYPFVVKSTTSSRGREVFLIKNQNDTFPKKPDKFYFAQEFIPNANRTRALVVGDKVVGAIKRQTKWNKDETKETLNPIPKEVEKLALFATNAAGLNICGVDILEDAGGKLWVIEANAAPSWKLINKYCGVIVENEIIKYLQKQV